MNRTEPSTATKPTLNPLSPKKLLNSKWTASKVVAKQKHFIVTKLIEPDAGEELEWIEIEAVYSQQSRRIRWRELQDQSLWLRGWQ